MMEYFFDDLPDEITLYDWYQIHFREYADKTAMLSRLKSSYVNNHLILSGNFKIVNDNIEGELNFRIIIQELEASYYKIVFIEKVTYNNNCSTNQASKVVTQDYGFTMFADIDSFIFDRILQLSRSENVFYESLNLEC